MRVLCIAVKLEMEYTVFLGINLPISISWYYIGASESHCNVHMLEAHENA